MSARFWKLFDRLEVSDITKTLFGSIAPKVMSLPDRRVLQTAGLLDLPQVDDLFRLLSVCPNTVTDSLGDVRGIYFGSSVAYRAYIGIKGRVRIHLKPFESLNKGNKSKHSSFLSQPGMSSNFRRNYSRRATRAYAQVYRRALVKELEGSGG